MKKQKKAFTLMEIMVVIVIIGSIAGFAIPNYTRTVERSYERDAITQLRTIHGANRIYHARTGGSFWPNGVGDLAAINTNLGINLISNGMTYSCNGNGTVYTCTATRNLAAPRNFVVQVTEAELDDTNPQCISDCP